MSLDSLKGFLARSDVEAAEKWLDAHPFSAWEEEHRIKKYIKRFWPSWFGEYKKVYDMAGKIEAQVSGEQVVGSVRGQWRYQAALNFMRRAVPGYAHILDFGCSRGAHAINLHNDLGDKRFTLMDIDAVSIQEAERLVGRLARHPTMFAFRVGDEGAELPKGEYDAALLFEILEHVKDLRALVAKVEASVKNGGWIMATIPSGPVEYSMWVEHPERLREHVRELTLDDIWDVFGLKDDLMIQYAMTRKSPHLDMAEGCYFFAYRVTGKPTREIGWQRKLSTDRIFEKELPGWETNKSEMPDGL